MCLFPVYWVAPVPVLVVSLRLITIELSFSIHNYTEGPWARHTVSMAATSFWTKVSQQHKSWFVMRCVVDVNDTQRKNLSFLSFESNMLTLLGAFSWSLLHSRFSISQAFVHILACVWFVAKAEFGYHRIMVITAHITCCTFTCTVKCCWSWSSAVWFDNLSPCWDWTFTSSGCLLHYRPNWLVIVQEWAQLHNYAPFILQSPASSCSVTHFVWARGPNMTL